MNSPMDNDERMIFYKQREDYRLKCEEFRQQVSLFLENFKPRHNDKN